MFRRGNSEVHEREVGKAVQVQKILEQVNKRLDKHEIRLRFLEAREDLTRIGGHNGND